MKPKPLPPRRHRVLVVALLSLTTAMKAGESAGEINRNTSDTGRYRLIWTGDPATSATIGWNQRSGEPGTVAIDTEDHGRKAEAYPRSIPPQRVQEYDGMRNCFVRLTGLAPGTTYFFCIRDQKGVSRRFQFRTAPPKSEPFTFIAGGDSRNFRDVRIEANRICRKLRPLFIAFTGDMINRDEPAEWAEWLDDWQETIADDGHLIPIVPHRGNHERRPETIPNHFDTPGDAYFAFSIGGNLFRYYTLNSEIPAGGAQEKWLRDDLSRHAKKVLHLVAGYHKPMRPHVSAKREGDNPMVWADTFYRFGLDLAIESDSHVMKRTLPLRPDPNGFEGFAAAPGDSEATVFIGEGCWGAPLRAADDAKPWTLDTESFNGLDWIQVSEKGISIKTVRISESGRAAPVSRLSSFETPEGLVLWTPGSGQVLHLPADR